MRGRAIAWAALVLVAVACTAGSAWAQNADSAAAPDDPHAAQPERPTVATHAGTVLPGWVEIEAGVERDHLDGAHVLLTPTVLKFGIVPRVQLELGGSFQHGSFSEGCSAKSPSRGYAGLTWNTGKL